MVRLAPGLRHAGTPCPTPPPRSAPPAHAWYAPSRRGGTPREPTRRTPAPSRCRSPGALTWALVGGERAEAPTPGVLGTETLRGGSGTPPRGTARVGTQHLGEKKMQGQAGDGKIRFLQGNAALMGNRDDGPAQRWGRSSPRRTQGNPKTHGAARSGLEGAWSCPWMGTPGSAGAGSRRGEKPFQAAWPFPPAGRGCWSPGASAWSPASSGLGVVPEKSQGPAGLSCRSSGVTPGMGCTVNAWRAAQYSATAAQQGRFWTRASW